MQSIQVAPTWKILNYRAVSVKCRLQTADCRLQTRGKTQTEGKVTSEISLKGFLAFVYDGGHVEISIRG